MDKGRDDNLTVITNNMFSHRCMSHCTVAACSSGIIHEKGGGGDYEALCTRQSRVDLFREERSQPQAGLLSTPTVSSVPGEIIILSAAANVHDIYRWSKRLLYVRAAKDQPA